MLTSLPWLHWRPPVWESPALTQAPVGPVFQHLTSGSPRPVYHLWDVATLGSWGWWNVIFFAKIKSIQSKIAQGSVNSWPITPIILILSLSKSSRRKFQWRHLTALPYCREATTCPFAKPFKCLNSINAMKIQDAQNIIILFVTKIVTIIAINVTGGGILTNIGTLGSVMRSDSCRG